MEQNNKILLIPAKQKPVLSAIAFRNIKGLIIDGKSRRPLAFSNIFLLNKSIATISNSNGRFELKIPLEEHVNDTLGVSFIGYKLFTIPVSEIDTGIFVARLSSDRVQIKEVIVKPLDPIYIITKAVERIPLNYDHKPAVLTAFFRESTKQDDKNVSLSEAVIDIFKEPYTSLRADQVRIYKGRKGSNTQAKEYVDFVVQGGLYNNLQLDIVKNHPTFLDADYFALYNYQVDKIITHLDRPTYEISFEQREGVKYPCYRGKVYIDVKSLAIVGASFEMQENELSYEPGNYIKKSPRKIKVRPVSAQYQVYYRPYNNQWNLSNVRSEITVRVRHKKDNQQDKFNCLFESTSEFVVTSKDTVNISRFPLSEVSRPKDVLVDQIGDIDLDFWGNENIIIPEEPIEKAIIRLGRKNGIFTDKEIAAIKIEEEKDAVKSDKSSETGADKTNDNDPDN